MDSSLQAHKCSLALLQSHPCSPESLSPCKRVRAGLAGHSCFPLHAPCRAPGWRCTLQSEGAVVPFGHRVSLHWPCWLGWGADPARKGSLLLSPFPSFVIFGAEKGVPEKHQTFQNRCRVKCQQEPGKWLPGKESVLRRGTSLCHSGEQNQQCPCPLGTQRVTFARPPFF